MRFWTAWMALLYGPFLISAQTEPQLQAVFTVIRHGDRAPTSFYPLDPFQDPSYWPNGIGELNSPGIERMKQTGSLYRVKYRKFLDATNGWPSTVKSSVRNRSIESARYFLESFMATRKSVNISSMIQLDQRMLTTTYPCNRSSAAWLAFFQSPEVTNYLESKRWAIEMFEGLTGDHYWNATPFTLRSMEFLATTLEIERDEYKLPVSPWISNETNIALLADLKKHAYLFDWQLPVMQKYRVGPLLGHIRDSIESLLSQTSDNSSSSQRFFLYSTHDVNQVLLLQSLSQYGQIGEWPTTYSSAIVFEVYKIAGQNYLRSLYRQVPQVEDQDSVAYGSYELKDTPLNISTCNDAQANFGAGKEEYLCSFESFKQLIEDKIPVNYEEECRSNRAAVSQVEIWTLFGTLLFTLLLRKAQSPI